MMIKKLAILLLSGHLMACGGGNDNGNSPNSNFVPTVSSNNTNNTNGILLNTLYATKVKVIDGDTIEILLKNSKSEKIRLLGIDAPESKQPNGKASTDNLKKCVSNVDVMIKWQEKDRYNRILGKVLANNIDCNLKQVEDGLAWHYKRYIKSQPQPDQLSYANAEFFARQAKKGLWSDPKAIEPWQWRQRDKTKQQTKQQIKQ